MSGVPTFYEEQAEARLSTIPWLAQLQKKALADFKRVGFPNRHQEDWKYTPVDAFLKQEFVSPKHTQNAVAHACDIPCQQSITISNGQVLGTDAWVRESAPGLLIKPLRDVLKENPDFLKPWLGQLLPQEHGFQALNSAILDSGVLIYLPAGLHLEKPILLHHWQDEANQAVYTRHLIIAEPGSQATIIEDYQGIEDNPYLTNTATELVLGDKALITHYKIQREGRAAFHIGHIAASLGESAQLNSHSLSVGGKLMRSDLSIHLQKERSSVLLNGMYAPGDHQHMDHHTTVYHDVPHCHSQQDYKGILTGQSRAVFNGKVIVAKHAQHSQAHQQNKNLLLSAKAEIDTKPQLEIFADDVVCSHGATVGNLDEDAMFYLTSRGIDALEASRYLIEGFIAANLDFIPDRGLATWMADLINQHWRKNDD